MRTGNRNDDTVGAMHDKNLAGVDWVVSMRFICVESYDQNVICIEEQLKMPFVQILLINYHETASEGVWTFMWRQLENSYGPPFGRGQTLFQCQLDAHTIHDVSGIINA